MTLRPFVRSLVLFLSMTAVALAQSTLVLNPPAGVPAKGKHIVLLSGDEEYRGEESLPMLAKILSQRHGFKTTVLFSLDSDGTINPDNQKSLPGAEALDSADLIIMALRFRAWPDAAMKHFVDAYRRGVPIIGLRTSTHAFNFPADSTWAKYSYNSKAPWAGGWGREALGETWVTHWGKHKVEATRGVIEPGADTEAVLRGITDLFGTADVYEARPPADAKILVRGLVLKGMNASDVPADYRKKRANDQQEQSVNDPAMPIVWTRLHRNEAGKENRILTTTMGAATDFENEGLRRLVVNGVYWGLGLEVPARADVRYLDPYAPRMYGFKGYRIGITPADHSLGRTLPEGKTPPVAASTAPSAPRPAAPAPASAAMPFSFNAGEHIAIVGNALADRMQHHGWLETMIYAQNPQLGLVVRNLAVPGDEIVTRARSKDFGTPDEWLAKVQAGVVFAFFGFNESFQGPAGLPKFKEDLEQFLRETRTKSYNGLGPPRIVLFSPIATEKHPDPNYAIPPETNRNLELYSQTMAEVARDQNGVTFVDLFGPSQQVLAEAARQGSPLTINGVHLSEAGEGQLVEKIFPLVFGSAAPTVDLAALRTAVNAKNAMWHSRYRTVDGYNIHGDRSKIAYVSSPDTPKITNIQVMQEEMSQRDVMTANLERRVWAVARGQAGPVEQEPIPEVTKMGTNKPGPNPDGTYEFISGEAAIGKMTLAPGLKINLFASEKEFPELAKPVQMAWDTRGRLWVAVWPNYPERTPTAPQGDSIIILEDTDGDGRADKLTTFLTDLNCPTGFQFFKDGILLVQAPDVWFVRDTDGDGRADWKERVLMGFDSADSHHTANSLVYEPGGAILLSDGVFHRTQVETIAGPVRNIDGAIYRYEPTTAKFETYASFNFMNPHGRAFDYWGNDLITDATGNHTYFGPAFSGRLDYPAKHPKMKTIWDRPSRPSAGSIILTSTHFPAEFWGNFLNPNVIGFQGVYRVKLVDDGSGIKGEREPDLLRSSDPNFRPIDCSVGPDGALYIIDWHNPLIGHLQSHLRDSNRDHEHGRIYRVTYEGRPLAVPPKIYGESIPALLELLKRPENQIRTLAKIELGNRDSASVIAALKTWTAQLDPKAPDYPHHLTEALWLHQWHNAVNLELLERVLQSPEPAARAAATRVVSYWRDRVPNALALLQQRAADENARVRLNAVRAASFFPVADATGVALTAAKRSVDYYLDYTLGETLRQLRPQWSKSIIDGVQLAGADADSPRYLLRSLSVAEVLKLPRNADVAENILSRAGVPGDVRAEALALLSKHRQVAPIALLTTTLALPTDFDVKGVGRLLLAQPVTELRAQRQALLGVTSVENAEARGYGWAAIALADGSLDALWQAVARNADAQTSVLAAIALIPDTTLRATAYDRVMALLAPAASGIKEADHVAGTVQREAIRAALSLGREPAAVFTALAAMIGRGEQVVAAATALSSLPRQARPPEAVARAARALVAWADKAHPSERTGRDYVGIIQIADELAGALPATEAEALRRTIKGLRVAVFVIRAVPEQLRYDTPRLVVPAGKAFEIIFENPDVMPHNLVVVKPNAREKVGTAAMTMLPETRDSHGRAFVPESTDVIAATRTLETGQSESLRVPGIRNEGVYEYICTFPGHWSVMFGQLVVTNDVDAYLSSNPLPASTPPAEHGVHEHGK